VPVRIGTDVSKHPRPSPAYKSSTKQDIFKPLETRKRVAYPTAPIERERESISRNGKLHIVHTYEIKALRKVDSRSTPSGSNSGFFVASHRHLSKRGGITCITATYDAYRYTAAAFGLGRQFLEEHQKVKSPKSKGHLQLGSPLYKRERSYSKDLLTLLHKNVPAKENLFEYPEKDSHPSSWEGHFRLL
jgi:hypothetical protein